MSVRPSVRYPFSKNPTNHLKSITNHPQSFLDASSHLYKRVCPSVCPSVRPHVRPSVRPSVRLSVTLYFFFHFFFLRFLVSLLLPK